MAPRRPKGAGAFPKPVESPVPNTPDPAELYAALDLGTNSCRMLIAQPKGSWKVDREFDENGNLIRYDSIYTS